MGVSRQDGIGTITGDENANFFALEPLASTPPESGGKLHCTANSGHMGGTMFNFETGAEANFAVEPTASARSSRLSTWNLLLLP